MAKGKMTMDNRGIAVVIIAAIVIFAIMNQGGDVSVTVPPGEPGLPAIDLCPLVTPEVVKQAQRTYTQTALTSAEGIRVIVGNRDLGTEAIDSSAYGVTGGREYTLFYCENSTTYYTAKLVYEGLCQEAPDDNVFGDVCYMDTAPSTTVFDENGQVNSADTNEVAIGDGELVDLQIKVKVANNKCYGNPQAPKGNALCFEYNGSAYEYIKVLDRDTIAAPFQIANAKGTGNTSICFDVDKLSDGESVTYDVQVKALSGINPAKNLHNISINLRDIAFDLNAETLAEIWDFQDESNNNLGTASIISDRIHVS